MAELADALDSKSGAFGRVGSTPTLGIFWLHLRVKFFCGVYTKDWGLGIFICLLGVNLSALSDDTESVVVEVFKSVGSSLYEFHFPVEAFSDTVVLSKSPHADDRFYPLG